MKPLDLSILSEISSAPDGRLSASVATVAARTSSSPKAVRLSRDRLAKAGLIELHGTGQRSTKPCTHVLTDLGRATLAASPLPVEGQEGARGEGQSEGPEKGKGGQRGVESFKNQEKERRIEDRNDDEGQDDEARKGKARGKRRGQGEGQEAALLALAESNRDLARALLAAVAQRDAKPSNVHQETPWHNTPAPGSAAATSSPTTASPTPSVRAAPVESRHGSASQHGAPLQEATTSPSTSAPAPASSWVESTPMPSPEDVAHANEVERAAAPGCDVSMFTPVVRVRRAKDYVLVSCRRPKARGVGYYFEALHQASGTALAQRSWDWSPESLLSWQEIVALLTKEGHAIQGEFTSLLALVPKAPEPAPPTPDPKATPPHEHVAQELDRARFVASLSPDVRRRLLRLTEDQQQQIEDEADRLACDEMDELGVNADDPRFEASRKAHAERLVSSQGPPVKRQRKAMTTT